MMIHRTLAMLVFVSLLTGGLATTPALAAQKKILIKSSIVGKRLVKKRPAPTKTQKKAPVKKQVSPPKATHQATLTGTAIIQYGAAQQHAFLLLRQPGKTASMSVVWVIPRGKIVDYRGRALNVERIKQGDRLEIILGKGPVFTRAIGVPDYPYVYATLIRDLSNPNKK